MGGLPAALVASLKKGDKVDAVKHDTKFDLHMWAVGEIKEVSEVSSSRLADKVTVTEKEFIVTFLKDAGLMPKPFDSKSKNIAPVGTFTKEEGWRDELYIGSSVDCLNAEDKKWYTATVMEEEQMENAKVPQIKVGYRQYHGLGEKVDSKTARYDGMGEAHDEAVPLFSARL